ncbi:MAG: PsiF family protein [Rhodanobacter sp.]
MTTPAPTIKMRTVQQQRMADCNKDATGKKGAERKTFMSSCLKGESAAAVAAPSAKQAQQERMKSCNADAKVKAPKGEAHKAFMSSCLKGDSAAAPATH